MTNMLREREAHRWFADLQRDRGRDGGCVARCAFALAVLIATAALGAARFQADYAIPRGPDADLSSTAQNLAAGHRRTLFEQRRQQFGARTALAGNDAQVMDLPNSVQK